LLRRLSHGSRRPVAAAMLRRQRSPRERCTEVPLRRLVHSAISPNDADLPVYDTSMASLKQHPLRAVAPHCFLFYNHLRGDPVAAF